MDIILGTAQLDGSYGRFRALDLDSSTSSLLKGASDAGFSTLDTAATYKGVEELIGHAEWSGAIHTKLDPAVVPEESIAKSLASLRRPQVDVLYFHDPDIVHADPWQTLAIRESIPRSMAHRLGVSVYTPEEALKALNHDALEVVQVPLNVVDGRWTDDLLKDISASGRVVIARSLFLQGALLASPMTLPSFLKPLRPVVAALESLAFQSNRSIVEILLGWAKGKPGISGIIVGAETGDQISELSSGFHASAINEEEAAILQSLALTEEAVLDPRRWPSD